MIIYSEYFRHLKYVVKKCLKKYTCRDVDVAGGVVEGMEVGRDGTKANNSRYRRVRWGRLPLWLLVAINVAITVAVNMLGTCQYNNTKTG